MNLNLDIETVSFCNRGCSTCIRNSYPDKEAISARFDRSRYSHLPEKYIYTAVEQAESLGFFNEICLSFYNEPLLDWRLPHIITNIKEYYAKTLSVYFHSNGDLMDNRLAKQLDGVVDKIIFTLYMKEPKKSERAKVLESFFNETEIVVITESDHIPTHFSPAYPVTQLAKQHRNRSCLEPAMRVIIGYDGKYRMCCEDLVDEFDLGTIAETSVGEHWEEKREYIKALSAAGGRRSHPYCESCPRP